jgi:hypothetical protein
MGGEKVTPIFIDSEYTCYTISVSLFEIVEQIYFKFKIGNFVSIARIM